MTESEPTFTCTVCGGPFGINPRVERWFTGNIPVREFRKVCLCWVCARLTASVAAESAQMAAELKAAIGAE